MTKRRRRLTAVELSQVLSHADADFGVGDWYHGACPGCRAWHAGVTPFECDIYHVAGTTVHSIDSLLYALEPRR